ncbi:TPA: LemA family protein [Providencia stuartii]|uniref:LemA family protein n=1 Tax=Providencia TaxID=586 RepID=UPI00197D6C74|nr:MULTISPECIES: LemA family protein [Providencia]MBN5558885.1 LemA family protein [Providencia stuartii]HEM8265824.1 LemA family protein [Providencia stuartii]HEM8285830.1 LemA family protein [Providencia stuartii]
MRKLIISILALIIIISVIVVTNYNSIQQNDEVVDAAASEVINQYQRRADLIPNLVNTVKGYSGYENKVLMEVVKLRTEVGQIKVDASALSDPAILAEYQKAQLGQSLSRLLAISESYPDLKASPLYQDLMTQLEGAENRITVARGRYIEAVRQYNTQIRKFPSNLIASYFGYSAKANFKADNEQAIKTVPTVDFN